MGKQRHAWGIGAAIVVSVTAVVACVLYALHPAPLPVTKIASPSRLESRMETRMETRAPSPAPKPHAFTDAEMKTFLAAAAKAEGIADPLQRCLAYPDPPGSHWTHAAVVAYCQYRNQPIITFAQVQDLVEHGKSAELDRLMAQALQAQQTQPQARGRLDRIFFVDFDNGSFDIRPTLDAWKRDSPNSAFAYAASGYAYVEMAYAARGSDFIGKTPASNIDAMDRLLMEGDADLQRAIALNPRITPIYIAMIRAGAFGLGERYMLKGARMGLQVAPADDSIYAFYIWAEQPQWFGSVAAMQRIVTESLKHANENPMLLLDKAEVPAYLDNILECCGRPTKVADFPAAFDEVTGISKLGSAASAAEDYHQMNMAVVYLSELVRFNAEDGKDRLHLARLVAGQPQLLLVHTQKLLAAEPDNAQAKVLHAIAQLSLGDVAHAEQGLLAVLARDPDNAGALSLLGRVYVYRTHQWNKGWDIANRLIQLNPELADGWRLRASIQLRQPRPGLDDTIHYFLAHFGNDPNLRSVTSEMQRILAAEAKGGKDPLAPFRG